MVERRDLTDELTALAQHDLSVRERLVNTGELFDGYNAEMRAVHRHNGDRLTEILDELKQWPGRELVGEAGSDAAFLIAQHDIANPALIRRAFELYKRAVDDGDADPVNLAYFDDRIRYFEGRPQRYGTHVGWDQDGNFGPWPPVEDPQHLDERRAALGLEPLASAIADRQAGRPRTRDISTILDEHRQADEFARSVGWRTDPNGV